MGRWWDRYPHRLRVEEQALEEAGFLYKIDEAAKERGRLIMHVHMRHPFEDCELKLTAWFPDAYPYFQPAVTSSSLNLPRHQHPTEKLLCLLANGGEQWRPNDTLASLLQEQLPALLRSSTGHAVASAVDEARQAEPLTAFLEYEPASGVILPPIGMETGGSCGNLIIGLDGLLPFRGTVLEVLDGTSSSTTLATATASIRERYERRQLPRVRGQWVRFPGSPSSRSDARALMEEVKMSVPGLKHLWNPVSDGICDGQGRKLLKIDVLGVLFDDEIEWRTSGNNWLVIVSRKYNRTDSSGKRVTPSLAMPQLDSPDIRAARVPELASLGQKTVALFGLGSLGSVAAVEFAKAGIGAVSLLDGDTLEVGNSVRWAIGRYRSGLAKAEALGEFLRDEYPATHVRMCAHRIGALPGAGIDRTAPESLDGEVVEEALKGADLILDASASERVNQYLSDLAREKGLPYVWMSTTNGAWGGLVGRVVPDVTGGCWMCHLHGIEDKSVKSPAAKPAEDLVQPPGCADPTFTGASFDIAQVTMMGVRLAIGCLTGGASDGYPDMDWDLGIVELRDESGNPVPPMWHTYALVRHPDCSCG